MAQVSENTTGTGNTAVPRQGDHDRVAMLSLKADGTPDQHNPELIGDKEFAQEATRRQFREQAVSAADVAVRGAVADTGAEKLDQDPQIAEMQKNHEQIAASAESAADKAVDALFTGETEAANRTADSPAGESTTASRTGTARSKSSS